MLEKIVQNLLPDLFMSFDTNQSGLILLDVKTRQGSRLAKLDVHREKIKADNAGQAEQIIEGDATA
jgi:hypothetical protein